MNKNEIMQKIWSDYHNMLTDARIGYCKGSTTHPEFIMLQVKALEGFKERAGMLLASLDECPTLEC